MIDSFKNEVISSRMPRFGGSLFLAGCSILSWNET